MPLSTKAIIGKRVLSQLSAGDYLLAGDPPYTYPSATLENCDEVGKQEAEKFIADMSSRFAT